MPNEKNHCRVCGFFFPDYLPWGEDGRTPSFDICPCCGVEFGYEDASPDGVRRYREKWLNDGANFNDTKNKPKDWNPEEQLANISGNTPSST